jgi:putative PIN family toxin of toxin-antitoxin system
VWISAFQYGGIPLAALRRGYKTHALAVCNTIFYEVQKTLTSKFGWTIRHFDEVLSDYLDNTVQIEISGELRGICRDSKDDMVLECALLAHADCIVTGDKDLLSLESFRGIRILTPRDFLDVHTP